MVTTQTQKKALDSLFDVLNIITKQCDETKYSKRQDGYHINFPKAITSDNIIVTVKLLGTYPKLEAVKVYYKDKHADGEVFLEVITIDKDGNGLEALKALTKSLSYDTDDHRLVKAIEGLYSTNS